MTKQELRDHFAELALQGRLAHHGLYNGKDDANIAYQIADAMLAVRENHKHEWVDTDCEPNTSLDIYAPRKGKPIEHTCTLCGKVELLEE